MVIIKLIKNWFKNQHQVNMDILKTSWKTGQDEAKKLMNHGHDDEEED